MTSSRVPDAVRHSSCRSAEPGPYQTPAFVTAPALQRTATQELRAALRPGNGASPEQRRPRHERIKCGPELCAKTVLLLQDFVLGAGDHQMRAGAQMIGELLD